MTPLTESLFSLQTLVRSGDTSPASKARIQAVSASIPPGMVAHLLRQLATGRRGIVWVRNDVCGECHLRLPRAMISVLAGTKDVLICESCGTFIALAPDVTVPPPEPAKPRAKRVRKTESQPVAA